jgi:hypothetical protein
MVLVVALSCLGLVAFAGAADPPGPGDAQRAALERDLRVLLLSYGPDHPFAMAVKARIAALREPDKGARDEPVITKKLLVVLTKQGGATLKDARIRQLGGRSFVVGVEVEAERLKITKPLFPGMVVWIPVDEVTQMVEAEDQKEK